MNGINYIELSVCAGVLALLLWVEWRGGRPRLGWRVAATILAVAALVGLVLPLRYRHQVRDGGDAEGVYLTEGYNIDSVRDFLARHKGVAGVWEGPGRVGRAVSRLHVFGYGLTGDAWNRIQAPELILHPSPPVEGVIGAAWQRRLYTGERLVVQGRWQGRSVVGQRPGGGLGGGSGTGPGAVSGDGPVKLVLMGFGAVLDSASADGDFSLATVPVQRGKAVYRLAAVRGRDTIEQEEIPVETGHGQPLKVLVLATSPGFENTFLVSWLAKSGQRAAVRTEVSRDRYQSSFVNMAARPLERLTASLLDGFDVVIADEGIASGNYEWELLRRAVEGRGLGLIVRTDSAYLRQRPAMRPTMRTMLTDSLSRPVVSVQSPGLGKIVYTAMNTTYIQEMAGLSAGYSGYWADLLRLASRQGATVDSWRRKPGVGAVGEEMDLSLQTADAMPQAVVVQEGRAVSVYLAEDEVLGFRWSGRYWPETAGWAAVNDTNWLYVDARGSWLPMRREERLRETASYRGKGGGKAGQSGIGEESVMMPKYWMYVVFLLSIFFLWVERKFF